MRDVDALLDDVHRPVDEEGASRHERITAGMDVSMPGAVVSVVDKRPVWQRVGDLDERSDREHRLPSVYATIPRRQCGLDLYWLRYGNTDATFADAQGSGRR